jgi:hypothetical protein
MEQDDFLMSGVGLSAKNRARFQVLKTNVIEKVQDASIRVRRLQDQPGVKVDEASNIYDAQTRYHGRVGSRIEDVNKTLKGVSDDIVKASRFLEKNGIKISDDVLSRQVNDYLIARHAPERNAAIGEGAAGISTEDARKVLSEIDAMPHSKVIKSIANRLSTLNKQTLDVLRDGGVISSDTHQFLRQRYPNHVPLQRIFEEDENILEILNPGKGFSVGSTGIKAAVGSQREVADIVGNIAANVQQAIVRSEKNIVAQSIMDFARKNKDLGLFREIKKTDIKGRIKDHDVVKVFENGELKLLHIADSRIAEAKRS